LGAPKVTKSACQQIGFFAALGLCPANQAKPGLQYFGPASLALCPASAKSCYALQPHLATIVLPDFSRSLSADVKKN
jgi:hypothetical protein